MSQGFDPYHKWLGISSAEQPANHYRLLGINLFEADPDVIQAAADQRMAHLKGLRLGKRVELSERLLNEVAAARACLLNPRSKEAYDLELATEIESSRPTVSLPDGFNLPPATSVAPVPDVPKPEPLRKPSRSPYNGGRAKSGRNWFLDIVLLAGLLAGCLVAYHLLTQQSPGRLSIVLENAPQGAVVLIDGNPVQNLAKSVPLTPGRHEIIIRGLQGRILHRQDAVVDAGEPKTIYVRVGAPLADE